MRRWPILLAAFALAACTRSNMDSQPSYREYKQGELFRNNRVLQTPPRGTVARGDIERAKQETERPPLTPQLLARGRDQYDVFCSPCHDRSGGGAGIVVERGFPKPPSLHEDRLRSATDQHIFDVISNGYGAMYAHGDRVEPRDRWAIVAYIRALQLSQHAAVADLSADERTKLGLEKTP